MRRAALAIALLAALNAGPAPAQNAAREFLEMPAHRVLMGIVATEPLAPFTTDGCSGGLSESWNTLSDLLPQLAERHGTLPPWESCCIRHDETYHAAGGASTAEESFAARYQADEDLRLCVLDTANSRISALVEEYGMTEAQIRASYEVISRAMFEAVRLGGVPCSGLPWRWGYGYPQCPVLPERNTGTDPQETR